MSFQENKLTEKEKELFKKTQEGTYDEVKRLLTEEKVSVDCIDEQGMTPLQQAAFRGNFELCKLFLDCGADVNSHHHTSGYSSLTFAGLSGKIELVSLLLEHGASTTSVNSVNRTATQMAAFVGNHNVVTIINNFIPREAIDYFTEAHGLEVEPKLPPLLSGPVHKIAVMTNIHPVRLAMYVQSNTLLLENVKKVINVLNILCEKQLKEEANELLSLKFHHLAFVLSACERFVSNQKQKDETESEPKKNILEALIKRWIKGGNEYGFPTLLEKFLRQSIREYPYLDCPLFQQLVHTLAPVKIGDEPSGISILSQAVNGQRGIDNVISCTSCGEPKAEKRCSLCHYVQYCDKTCQKLHWFTHKTVCSNLKFKYEQELKEQETEPLSELTDNENNK